MRDVSMFETELEETEQSEIDARWAKEAEDRIAAYERGELIAIPGDEVFSSLKIGRGA
jgi:hypothetical protein